MGKCEQFRVAREKDARKGVARLGAGQVGRVEPQALVCHAKTSSFVLRETERVEA